MGGHERGPWEYLGQQGHPTEEDKYPVTVPGGSSVHALGRLKSGPLDFSSFKLHEAFGSSSLQSEHFRRARILRNLHVQRANRELRLAIS